MCLGCPFLSHLFQPSCVLVPSFWFVVHPCPKGVVSGVLLNCLNTNVYRTGVLVGAVLRALGAAGGMVRDWRRRAVVCIIWC